MAVAPISGGNSSVAYGLDFQSLLKIILTQLTYQDPLKPVDNFQFVSQLAQFSQLQQSQTLNDQMSDLLAAQAANQATSLLGRTVDYVQYGNTYSGKVIGVSFQTGRPEVSVETAPGALPSSVSIAEISAIRT